MATVTPLRIGPADHGRRLTMQEFLDAEEQGGYRYELARGVLEVTQIPSDWHAAIVWLLLDRISQYGRAHPGAFRYAGSGGDFRFWMPQWPSGRHPDAAVVPRGAARDAHGRRIPALAIEVVSEGKEAHDRDYVAKRGEYLAYGLLEYWIVDRFQKRVTVLMRDGDTWQERVFHGDATAAGRVLPGFEVPLAGLWAAADEADADDRPA